MNIISTNLSVPVKVKWRGKEIQTGIFKKPVDHPVFLDVEDVRNDHVIDRKHHGGVDKACYLYPADHYPFWKSLYPGLDWIYGMMGENLTVSGLMESDIHIDDVLQVGEAVVQVTQPRQPCFKLGIRFNTQKVLKDFIQAGYPGIYVKVLSPGYVKQGDLLQVKEKAKNGISVTDVFHLLYQQEKPADDLVIKVMDTISLPAQLKAHIKLKAGR